MTFRTTIEIADEEREIVIEAEYHAFQRGATDGRHGPKIEPDEPAHWELESVRWADTGAAVALDVFSDDDALGVIEDDCNAGRFERDVD